MERIWHRFYDEGVPTSIEYPERTVPHFLLDAAKEYPRRTATNFLGATMSYCELAGQVNRLAAALLDIGIKKGERVAVMLPNCPQAVISYYAILRIGAVAVMTNPMYVEREMAYQFENAGVKALIILDHLFPKADKILGDTEIETVIVTSLREYLPWYLSLLYPLKARKQNLFTRVPYNGSSILNFKQLISKTGEIGDVEYPELDDLALLQYTGGTTGVPKGVMLTHKNIMCNTVQTSMWFPTRRKGEERVIAILPFFHVFGMTVAMNWPIYNAGTIILVPRFEVKDFVKTLSKTRPTVFPGVPTIYIAINSYPEIEKYDISSIRFCITGSAPMPVETIKRFEELTKCRIVEGYGLTEASPVTHVNPLQGIRKVGSIGIAISDTDCRIVDLETGEREVPTGELGELIVKGPQVMRGYWKLPEETSETLRDGWLYTGDIASMDEDGYVFIADRKKDMIIAGGFNIYPREIDEVLYEHPNIREAVTVGVPDPYRGETVKAFVVLKEGVTMTEEEVIAYCKSKLAAYKVPTAVEFRESLPKTVVGKILRKILREEELKKQKG